MFNTRNGVESRNFKRLARGFIFQPPHPWLFGSSPCYFATDMQKAAILDVMAPDQPVWKGITKAVAFIVAATLWVLAMTMLLVAFGPTDHNQPTPVEGIMIMVAGGVAMLIAMYVALCLRARVLLRRLRPLLVTLPHRDERISRQDVRVAMIHHTSFERLLFAIAILAAASVAQAFFLGFVLGMMLVKGTLSAATLPFPVIFMLCISLVLIAQFAVMLFRKAKQNSTDQLAR
jgi:hypothetical protein